MPTSHISVLRTAPSTILSDYKRLLSLSEYQHIIDKGTRVLLKLNLSWSLYYPACSTQPWQLEGIVKTLKEDQYSDILAVENRTVVTDIAKGLAGNRWSSILERYHIPFLPLTRAAWIPYHAKSDTPALDEIFKGTHQIPREFIGTSVVNLPTVKTHGHTITTGAMKNAFGGLITERRHHCHKLIHEILVDLLTVQKEIHPAIFSVMDGTVCGNGKGPRTMIPYIGNIILAGEDQVAIDAIAAKIMGFDPLSIPYIRMAHDRGLGCGDPDQIETIGDDIRNLNFHFKTGKSLVISGDQLFRKGGLYFLEPLVFHTPLFFFAIKSSWFYHDVFWYNVIGKRRIREYNLTGWGKLFESYR
jgi:uncharacterized protein (DUF362 family)